MMLNPNILNEGNQMEVLDVSKAIETGDELDIIVRCNNCGQATEYGKTRMCSGFVGCDNLINVKGESKQCYFEDLMPRVIKAEGHRRGAKLYRWRDGADGGLDETDK